MVDVVRSRPFFSCEVSRSWLKFTLHPRPIHNATKGLQELVLDGLFNQKECFLPLEKGSQRQTVRGTYSKLSHQKKKTTLTEVLAGSGGPFLGWPWVTRSRKPPPQYLGPNLCKHYSLLSDLQTGKDPFLLGLLPSSRHPLKLDRTLARLKVGGTLNQDKWLGHIDSLLCREP